MKPYLSLCFKFTNRAAKEINLKLTVLFFSSTDYENKIMSIDVKLRDLIITRHKMNSEKLIIGVKDLLHEISISWVKDATTDFFPIS